MESIVINDVSYTLSELEEWIWHRLSDACKRRKQAWRTGVLATDGPNARTVVLRNVESSARKLVLFTDQRSAKIGEIECNPQVAWMFWDERKQMQLRIKGKAHIITSEKIINEYWDKLPDFSRKDYATYSAPGAPLNSLSGQVHSDAVEFARQHFTVIETSAESMDWLQLNREGHRRAIFEYQNTSNRAFWATP